MPNYYVNTRPQTNGDHEVHTDTCRYLPAPEHQKALGYFFNCADAVREAKKTFPKANGCYYCANACHTS